MLHTAPIGRSPMRIITLNVNGIRSAELQGLTALDGWSRQCSMSSVSRRPGRNAMNLGPSVVSPHGYHSFFHHCGSRKGYSWRGPIHAQSTSAVGRLRGSTGIPDFDREGRYLQSSISRDYSVVSLYILLPDPRVEARQESEVRVPRLLPASSCAGAPARGGREVPPVRRLEHRAQAHRSTRTGARTRRTPASCPRSAPGSTRRVRRDWLGGRLSRKSINAEPEQYTWWSNRGQAWAKNVGWRIDYQIVTPAWRAPYESARIYKESALFRPCPAHHGLRSMTAAEASGNEGASVRLSKKTTFDLPDEAFRSAQSAGECADRYPEPPHY